MYSGWIVKWKLNRPLTREERDSALPRNRQEGIKADNHATVVAFNSTYAEFVGRRFLLRGGFKTFGSTFAVIGYVLVPAFILFSIPMDSRNIIGLSIFFHIGRGLRDPVYDLRGHLLEGDTVKDTFVAGLCYTDQESVKALWEFVRRYMDEGVESLGKIEIWTTPAATLMNSRIIVGVYVGGTEGARAILWPFWALLIATRWLVMKTSKPPVWPAEIEAACRIEPDDPHRLPEPEYTGQFGVEREMAKQRASR
ncbi:MAG: hypothetical protein P8014_19965 [Acidihalobacter sp.]|uniref:DUF6708 domain-containing protein n=1 Tax=Acidihalobacter sp. TaxID=1872108 RepID=UPI00307D6D1C